MPVGLRDTSVPAGTVIFFGLVGSGLAATFARNTDVTAGTFVFVATEIFEFNHFHLLKVQLQLDGNGLLPVPFIYNAKNIQKPRFSY